MRLHDLPILPLRIPENLRFFEAFLILALRQNGLDFISIGILITIREVAGNLSQIPSGAIADAFGRKRCMVASMTCYAASYFILGLSGERWLLMLAMVFYGTLVHLLFPSRDSGHRTKMMS